MVNWMIVHAPYVGVAGLGFLGGVVYAAWRQLVLEEREMRFWRWLGE